MNIREAMANVFKNKISPPPEMKPRWQTPYEQSASEEDIFYCFRLLLGRSPNREEWIGHTAKAGSNIDSVVGAYVSSLEFSRRLSAFLSPKIDDRISLVNLDGFALYVSSNDLAVGKHIKDGVAYEPHVTAVFRQKIKAGMHVLDIGANIGYFTMLSAFLVKSSGSVTAIEPNGSNTKLLEASRRENKFNNIIIIQAAAGRETGLLVLNASDSNGTTAGLSDNLRSLIDSNIVPSFKIDDLLPKNKKIDFLKIDVEGAEYNALKGASEIIARDHPVIVSEFSPDMLPGISGVTGAEYLNFLIGFGYKIAIIEQSGDLTDCGKDIDKVANAYLNSGVDHIDIFLD